VIRKTSTKAFGHENRLRRQLNNVENCLINLTNERMLLETKLEILISVQEWLKTALEKDSVVKYVALEKFET